MIYPPGVNTATYAIDKAIEIFFEDFDDLKNEASVTWVGRLVDWAFGWGKHSVKKIEDINSESLAVKTALEIKKTDDGIYYLGSHEYNCPSPANPTQAYTQVATLYVWDPTSLSSASNDPNQFLDSWTGCIQYMVLPYYYDFQVGNSTAGRECLLGWGEEVYQGVTIDNIGTTVADLAVATPQYYSSNYFVNQSSIYFSAGLMTQCYENNLVQTFNDQLEPVINYNKGNLNCASGSVNIQYLNEWCTRSFVMNNFQLILSLFDGPSVPFPFYHSFISNYCECSLNATVLPYFQSINASSTCAPLKNQSITYPIGTDGSFTVFASEGLPLTQFRTNFSSDAIQQCYLKSYQRFEYKAATIGIITCIGLAALTTCVSCLAWKTKCFRTLEIQKRIKTALHNREHKNWEELL
jgi:hypothetical protein